nr:AAA family ATPase [Bacteroides acidifaciens]
MESTCIITFANQKGGVGKTTLCALFASYLVSRGHSVTVFDTDPQQSIVKKRTADTATYAGVPLPYNVYPFSMSNEPALIALIENLHGKTQ